MDNGKDAAHDGRGCLRDVHFDTSIEQIDDKNDVRHGRRLVEFQHPAREEEQK